MEYFFDRPGLWHIPESIFRYLSIQDLENCCEVSLKTMWFLTKRRGMLTVKEDWNFIESKQVYCHKSYEPKTLADHFPDFKIAQDYYVNANNNLFREFASEVKKMILESEKLKFTTNKILFTNNPLMKAIKERRGALVKLLIQSPMHEKVDFREALTYACIHGNLDAFKVIEAKASQLGIDVNEIIASISERRPGSILHHMMFNSQEEEEEEKQDFIDFYAYFLKKSDIYGIDLNITNNSGFNALESCISYQDMRLIEVWCNSSLNFTLNYFTNLDTKGKFLNFGNTYLKIAMYLVRVKKTATAGEDVTEAKKLFMKNGKKCFENDVCIKVICFLLRDMQQKRGIK